MRAFSVTLPALAIAFLLGVPAAFAASGKGCESGETLSFNTGGGRSRSDDKEGRCLGVVAKLYCEKKENHDQITLVKKSDTKLVCKARQKSIEKGANVFCNLGWTHSQDTGRAAEPNPQRNFEDTCKGNTDGKDYATVCMPAIDKKIAPISIKRGIDQCNYYIYKNVEYDPTRSEGNPALKAKEAKTAAGSQSTDD